jgi:urocanate hydratase
MLMYDDANAPVLQASSCICFQMAVCTNDKVGDDSAQRTRAYACLGTPKRHANAKYKVALDCAKKEGLKIQMTNL